MCFIECLCNVIGSNIYDKEWGNNKGKKVKNLLDENEKIAVYYYSRGRGEKGRGEKSFSMRKPKPCLPFHHEKKRGHFFRLWEKEWTLNNSIKSNGIPQDKSKSDNNCQGAFLVFKGRGRGCLSFPGKDGNSFYPSAFVMVFLPGCD